MNNESSRTIQLTVALQLLLSPLQVSGQDLHLSPGLLPRMELWFWELQVEERLEKTNMTLSNKQKIVIV